MNLYLKYCPILYYIKTRVTEKCSDHKQLLVESMNQIWSCLWIWGTLIIYLIYTYSFIEKFYLSLFLYIYIYLIFIVFYEIWCIHNDYVAIIKEKNVSIHTKENPPLKWYRNSILIRFFTGIFLLLPFLYLNIWLLCDVTLFVILVLLVFYLHNSIRISFYNRLTLFLLRFLKYAVVFIVLFYFLWSFNFEKLFLSTFIIFVIDFFSQTLNWISNKMWWENKILVWNVVLINMITCLILFLILRDYLFLWYVWMFFCMVMMITPKKYLRLAKNPTSREK